MPDESDGRISHGQNSAVAPSTSSVPQFTAAWSAADQCDPRAQGNSRELFRAAWWAVNTLLLASILAIIYAAGWEYSARRYLKGFSDAIVPASGSPEQKIQAILDWMSQGPARQTSTINISRSDRHALDTVNYRSLLEVCGTATNAFLNLADSSGLSARRILLLDPQGRAKHIDAEVLVNGRWIVVDPTFRVVLKGPDGTLFTRAQLTDPAKFALATQNVPNYDPGYRLESTAHVRLSRVPLIMEGKPLALVFASINAMLLLIVVRLWLRRYGERHLHVRIISIRRQFRRAGQAFLETPS